MTEFSWNFSCTPDTGDAGPLTAENLAAARLFLNNPDPQLAGVIAWSDDTPANILFPGTPPGLSSGTLDGLLAPSDAGGGIVNVAAGIGLALGRLYVSDAVIQFDINNNPGQASATDLIVLRRNNLASVEQSVRLLRKQAATPSSTAVVQQDGTIWEVAIAEVVLDSSGELASVTDVRQYIAPAVDGVTLDVNNSGRLRVADDGVDTAQLADDAVDDTKAGNRVPQFYRRQGADASDWDVFGTTTYIPGAVRMQAGAKQNTGVSSTAGSFAITFPVAFSQSPLVWITGYDNTARLVWSVSNISTTGFTATWRVRDQADGNQTDQTMTWLAIGPE